MNRTDSYIINPVTMGLLPMNSPFGELWTIILETTKVFIVKKKPIEIIDESCHWFGSSYAGGKSSVAAIMGYKSMFPINISSELGICLFPLASAERRDTVWLAHAHIKDWVSKDRVTTTVRFMNYQVMDLLIARSVFEWKTFRAGQYRHSLRETVEDYKVFREQINRHQTVDLNGLITKTLTGTFRIVEDAPDERQEG